MGKIDNLESKFKVGQEVDVEVLSIDNDLGRINLSLKSGEDDPFAKFAEKIKDSEIIKGEVIEVSSSGVKVKLEEGIEGFIASSKLESDLEVGQTLSVTIENIDSNKRRINLSPFITTTKGLIYK